MPGSYDLKIWKIDGKKTGGYSLSGGPDEINGLYKDIFKLMKKIQGVQDQINNFEVDSFMDHNEKVRLLYAAGKIHIDDSSKHFVFRFSSDSEADKMRRIKEAEETKQSNERIGLRNKMDRASFFK